MSTSSNIFLTGVTGFVGKVVLENLLRRRTELNINTVYVLIRQQTNPRTGVTMSAEERFKKLSASPCFSELPEQWQQNVQVVPGELTEPGLGIEPEITVKIQEKLTKIINCAASVEFDLPIAAAASMNITSALNVLGFARNCPGLDSFVNVSTAYVSPHMGDSVPVPEALVELPFDPEMIYQSILDGTADEKALMAQTGHPNTYTFTKCLCEQLLNRNKGDIPLAIVRPSIISASWQYPRPGWIDSYAAFAAFVSLIGSGLLKCAEGQENAVVDIVPCDEVANSVVLTSFWPSKLGKRPLIQHIVTGVNKGCRIDTCVTGIESYFQRNPVNRWAELKKYSNGKPLHFHHWRLHTLPSSLARLWFTVSGQPKQKRRAKSLLNKIEYVNKVFPYFTHNTFNFEAKSPLVIPLESKFYIELVCKGVHENLMLHKPEETTFAGARHKHPKNDLPWVSQQPDGNWAIRTASYFVRKGLRKCTDWITFDRPSFQSAMTQVDTGTLLVVVPNHRSYMDFVLCSYLFFAHPELHVPIPQIAAASEFARIPFLGWFFQQTYAFYIQRGHGKEDPELRQKIQTLVDKNQTLEFFIEGARSRARQFLKPRRGLLRALQNTGIPCTLLPVAISYDLVPEENAFLTELRAGPKSRMRLSSLLKWTARMFAGKVKLGRVHIVCGTPVTMNLRSDVHQVSIDVMQELQDRTAVSSFHLKAFLRHNPIPGLDLDWLQQAIMMRGGRVIESPLEKISAVDKLNERTMRFHWMHYFYPELLALQPVHPGLQYHVRENAYSLAKPVAETAEIANECLAPLLRELFSPLVMEYTRIPELAARNNGTLPEANEIVLAEPDSFLPFVEEVLSAMTEFNLLEKNTAGKGYKPGPRWDELSNFSASCRWNDKKALNTRMNK